MKQHGSLLLRPLRFLQQMHWRLWLSNQDGSGRWWPEHEQGKLQVSLWQALRKNSEMELQSPLEMCTREPKYLVSRGRMVAKMTTFLKKIEKLLQLQVG